MAENRNVGLDIRVLEDRQVLVFFGDNPVFDKKTGAFVGGWESLGIEPVDSSHSHTREISENDTNLTGGQTDTSYTTGALSGTVDGIAGSPVMRYIENPDAVVQDGTVYGAHTAKVARAYVAYVHKFSSGIVRVWVSREKADLKVNERQTSKDPQARPVTIKFKNGADEFYYEERFYMVGKDGSVARVEEKVFQDVTELTKKIEAGEAFYPQASGSGLTAMTLKKDDSNGVDLQEFEGAELPEGAAETVNPSTDS